MAALVKTNVQAFLLQAIHGGKMAGIGLHWNTATNDAAVFLEKGRGPKR